MLGGAIRILLGNKLASPTTNASPISKIGSIFSQTVWQESFNNRLVVDIGKAHCNKIVALAQYSAIYFGRSLRNYN